MTTLKISDGLVKDDLLVVGLVSTNTKGGIAIESGDLALDSTEEEWVELRMLTYSDVC